MENIYKVTPEETLCEGREEQWINRILVYRLTGKP